MLDFGPRMFCVMDVWSGKPGTRGAIVRDPVNTILE